MEPPHKESVGEAQEVIKRAERVLSRQFVAKHALMVDAGQRHGQTPLKRLH